MKSTSTHVVHISEGAWHLPAGMNGELWQKCRRAIQESGYKDITLIKGNPASKVESEQKDRHFIEEAISTQKGSEYTISISTWVEIVKTST